ncbi:hypothetical protein ACLOJK_039216 [Asimina triloba]
MGAPKVAAMEVWLRKMKFSMWQSNGALQREMAKSKGEHSTPSFAWIDRLLLMKEFAGRHAEKMGFPPYCYWS